MLGLSYLSVNLSTVATLDHMQPMSHRLGKVDSTLMQSGYHFSTLKSMEDIFPL